MQNYIKKIGKQLEEIVMTVTKRGKYERKERNSDTKSRIINIE